MIVDPWRTTRHTVGSQHGKVLEPIVAPNASPRSANSTRRQDASHRRPLPPAWPSRSNEQIFKAPCGAHTAEKHMSLATLQELMAHKKKDTTLTCMHLAKITASRDG